VSRTFRAGRACVRFRTLPLRLGSARYEPDSSLTRSFVRYLLDCKLPQSHPLHGGLYVTAQMVTVAVDQDVRGGDWRSIVARYQGPSVAHALWQLGTSVGLLALTFVVMAYSLAFPYWVTLALAIPAAGFMLRSFIVMHDCAHGSYLPWRRANEVIGFITGVLTLTPFDQWRRDHALHHATSGDLDRRGNGDINTLTVREYLARTPAGRAKYRAFRNPLVLLVLGPIHLAVNQRFRPRSKATGTKQIKSVLWTNIGIVFALAAFSLLFGVRTVALVYVPVYMIAGSAGIWLFYVQHQFEDTYWEDHGEWDYATAAIRGSSYLKLPPVLQWMTGSIGLHHVHHLGPRIPNYRLQQCHDENPLFHDVTVVTWAQGIAALRLTLWDEERLRLVRFRDVA
jgi:acyl-lipid omega-6 desaturase (Delta-12 desaturase)